MMFLVPQTRKMEQTLVSWRTFWKEARNQDHSQSEGSCTAEVKIATAATSLLIDSSTRLEVVCDNCLVWLGGRNGRGSLRLVLEGSFQEAELSCCDFWNLVVACEIMDRHHHPHLPLAIDSGDKRVDSARRPSPGAAPGLSTVLVLVGTFRPLKSRKRAKVVDAAWLSF